MGFFQFLKRPDINRGVEEFRATPGALLLDVRTPEEFREGRIPGSRNLPLQELERAPEVIEHEDVPVFLYCRSGNRSATAERILRGMGYAAVIDLGGILSYRGERERS